MAEFPSDETREPNAIQSDRPAETAETTLPRLRLHHFFALTAVMAVLLAIGGPQRDFSTPQFEQPQLLRTFQVGVNILYQALAAVAVTALAYGYAGYRRGRPFFNQPGHWLLVELSLFTLVAMPVTLAARMVDFNSQQMQLGDFPMIVMMIIGVYSLLFFMAGRVAINIYLAVTKCSEDRWRNVFIAKAVSPVTLGLAEIAVMVLALLASRADRREQIPRDAAHRCGVWVQLATSALALFGGIVGILTMIVMMIWQM
jgi:hypothetical protein